MRRAAACGALAVLTVACPAAAQEAPTPELVDAAVARAVERLLALQQPDGSWEDVRNGDRPGLTALVTYALLASGVHREQPAIERAVRRLSVDRVSQTYDAACVLLALVADEPTLHRGWIEELVGRLLGWREPEGDWGYPGRADLSNTQFAAFALRAAASTGVPVPERIWTQLRGRVDAYHRRGGGYGYLPHGGRATSSMTAAGIGLLALAAERLDADGESDSTEARHARARRDEALVWLGSAVDRALDPERASRSLYGMYGIERVGSLLGIARIGDVDWYALGSARLLAAQGAPGSWGTAGVDDDLEATAFALLFLRRATRNPLTGPDRERVSRTLAESDAGADVQVRAAGRGMVTLWITGFGSGLLERLGRAAEDARPPRVEEVVWLDGERVVGRAQPHPDLPPALQTYAARHAFRVVGVHRVRARVTFLEPPDGPARRVVVDSPELELRIARTGPAWTWPGDVDRGPDRMREAEPGATASTSADSRGGGAGAAVDGRLSTSWVAAEKDREPRLEIRLGRPVEADLIRIWNAIPQPWTSGALGRAVELDVLLNGARRFEVRMSPDELEPGRIELEAPTRVESLVVRIPWSVPGSASSSVGVAEVELQLRER